LYKWKAHYSGVTSLSIVEGAYAPALLSTGKDCRARVWSLNGQYWGTLRDNRDNVPSDSWQFDPPSSLPANGEAADLDALLAQAQQESDNANAQPNHRQRPTPSPLKIPKPIPIATRYRVMKKRPLVSSSSYSGEATSPLARTQRTPRLDQTSLKEEDDELNLIAYLNQVCKNPQKKYSEKQKQAAEKLMSALGNLNV